MNKSDLLLGELKNFRDMTLTKLENIERDVKELQVFRWKQAGAILVISGISGGLVSLVLALLPLK